MSRLYSYEELAEFVAAGVPAAEVAQMYRCAVSTVRKAVRTSSAERERLRAFQQGRAS